MNLNIKFEGVREVREKLRKWFEGIENFGPAWKDIRNDFYKFESEQFASEGARSSPWRELSPRYAAYKRKRYPGRPILVRTGDLRQSLTTRTATGAKFKGGKVRMEIGTKIDYASYHQTGTSKMPKRKIIDLLPMDRSRWVKIMQVFVARMGKLAGWSKKRG